MRWCELVSGSLISIKKRLQCHSGTFISLIVKISIHKSMASKVDVEKRGLFVFGVLDNVIFHIELPRSQQRHRGVSSLCRSRQPCHKVLRDSACTVTVTPWCRIVWRNSRRLMTCVIATWAHWVPSDSPLTQNDWRRECT